MLIGGAIMLVTGIGDFYVNKLQTRRFEMNIERGSDFSRGDLPPVGSGGDEESRSPQTIFVVGYFIAFIIELVGGLLYFQVI